MSTKRGGAKRRAFRPLSPGRLAGIVAAVVLGASSLLACAPQAATAESGTPGGDMTVVPSTAVAGSTANSFDFTFVAQGQTAPHKLNGIVGLLIPADWTAPVATGRKKSPGHVSITSTSCAEAVLGNIKAEGAPTSGHAAGPWLLRVTVSCRPGRSFTLHYAKATVSDQAGNESLPATFKNGQTTTSLDESPGVSIAPGPVASLDVQASPSALNPRPATQPANADVTGTFSSTITTLGLDQFGNVIGNVDADTSLSIGPDGDCENQICTEDPGSSSAHTVTATDGAASGATTIATTLVGLDMTCQGEHYDVNGNMSDGCEAVDAPQGNHTVGAAANEGTVSDCDTPFEIDGTLLSDARVHAQPAVTGFDTASGSAPDWMSVLGQGNTFCENDLVVTLQVSGSQQPDCYRLTAITNKEMYDVQTDNTGLAQINEDSGGQFSDNTTIDFEVQKTCSTELTEDVSYSITGHL
jgi:hypothetical protein